MDIVKTNFKAGTAVLRVNDQDDLWYLSTIIEPGDFIKSKTTRKVKIGDSENAKVTKKTITLTIEAETIQLAPETNSLRINGKIKEGPEDIPKDSYHAIALFENSEFTIEKPNWLEYQKKKLKEASEKKYNYLLCILDREEALFALTKEHGYTILVKIKGDVPKKSKDVEIKKDFQQEIIKALDTYAARYTPESIILASPAFYRENLFKAIKDDTLKKKIVLATASSVSENALDEVLKRPELRNVLKNSRAREEQLVVEELLTTINKEGPAAYGEKEVITAVDAGAISTLLITDEFIKTKREHNEFQNIDKIMKTTDALKGKIHIISSEHEGGKKLNGLGGIAAILRYKL